MANGIFREKSMDNISSPEQLKKIPITSIGRDDDGHVFAVADTKLDDGSYHAFVHYKKTQVLRLLFDE